MDNFINISEANDLNKIIETIGDKLIILMFFSKTNPECRKIYPSFEKCSYSHTTSYFCVIDIDKFHGKSKYWNNVTNIPRFDFYYAGEMIGSYSASSDKELDNYVRIGEQYVITKTNMRNTINNQGTYPNTYNLQMQQQILNNAQMQNPGHYQYLMQNPLVLQNMVQKQMAPPPQPTVIPTPIVQPSYPMLSQPIPPTIDNALPTLQQMQQMFQIFQMMQQMGVLNTSAPTPIIPTSEPESKNTIVLPSGDKIIPLGNGKYGLIKKN